MKGKKLLSLLLALVLVFALCGTALAAQDKNIVVLYTNDVHCAVDDNIGYAGLAAYKAEMAKDNYVTLVDDGDALQGAALGTLSKGEYLVEIMNQVGYNVCVPGNHEFDYGMSRFLELAKLQKAGYICCNFIDLRTGKPVFDSYKMVTYGDVKIAYVGIDTPESFTKSTPTYFQDANGNYIYSFCEGNNGADLYKAVQTAIDAAKAAGATYVVAVGHLGVEETSAPWRSTDVIANTTGLTAFIDGHSHSTIASQSVTDKAGKTVLLSSTGTKLAAIGKLTLKTDGTVTTELVTGYTQKDAATDAFVKDIQAKNAALLKTVVAKTDVTLTIKGADGKRAVRSAETNLGDLCADAYRIIGNADIGWVNGGGVRADIAAGDITYEQIIAVHPYGNALCVVEATGQEIIDALEMASRNCPGENGGFLQVSGLKYTIDTTIASSVKVDDKKMFVSVDGARRVKDVMVMNKTTGVYEPIDLTKTYTLASHDYMLKSAGDGINMFKDNKFIKDSIMLDNQVLITYITENLGGVVPAAYAKAQGRITVRYKASDVFTDVVSTEWYNSAIQYCLDNKLVVGKAAGIYGINDQMTVGEYFTALYRIGLAMGADYPDKATEGANWTEAAKWLAAQQNLTLTDEQLAAPITREVMAASGAEFIKSIASLLKWTVAVDSARAGFTFKDAAAIGADYAADVSWFYSVKGIDGYEDGSFKPQATARRCEVAQIFYNMLEVVSVSEASASSAA